MIYRIEAACGSNIGKVRKANEDNFYFDGTVLPQENHGQRIPLHFESDKEEVCLAVFDGMGGFDHGEAASFAAAIELKEILKQPRQADGMEMYLEELTQRLNLAVCDAKASLSSNRMGSTAALLYFCNGLVYVSNVGDSRIFGLRGSQMIQISYDHTDEAYMKERGIVGRKPRLTQYLGMNPDEVLLEPYIQSGNVRGGDTYLICSDGLTDMMTPEEIRDVLMSGESARKCAEALINGALEHGGRDNVTVIVCRVLEMTDPTLEETAFKREVQPEIEHDDIHPLLNEGRRILQGLHKVMKNVRRK